MNEELSQIKAWNERIDGKPANGSYTAAAAAGGQDAVAVPRAVSVASQESQSYWQFRKCAKISPVPGETKKELLAPSSLPTPRPTHTHV